MVDLRLGRVEELPTFNEPFDKILAVNAMMFWRGSRQTGGAWPTFLLPVRLTWSAR